MSRYLVSDLHGDFTHFKKLLEKIKYDSDTDTMYVLGDVIDRGDVNLPMLDFIRNAKSMHVLKGNHEYFAQMYLEGKLDDRKWSAWGGKETLEEIKRLSQADRMELKDYLSNMEYYYEIEVDGSRWVLTHSGLNVNSLIELDGQIIVTESIMKGVADNEFNYLVSHDIHYMAYSDLKKLDCFVVVGHTPTIRINEDGSYKITHTSKVMCIDSGAGHRKSGGKMSCYCIETGEEIYL